MGASQASQQSLLNSSWNCQQQPLSKADKLPEREPADFSLEIQAPGIQWSSYQVCPLIFQHWQLWFGGHQQALHSQQFWLGVLPELLQVLQCVPYPQFHSETSIVGFQPVP